MIYHVSVVHDFSHVLMFLGPSLGLADTWWLHPMSFPIIFETYLSLCDMSIIISKLLSGIQQNDGFQIYLFILARLTFKFLGTWKERTILHWHTYSSKFLHCKAHDTCPTMSRRGFSQYYHTVTSNQVEKLEIQFILNITF